MSQGTEIKVCILSYNRPDYLKEALLSVLRQTRSAEQPGGSRIRYAMDQVDPCVIGQGKIRREC